jgi:branched-chain amino acid transport system substrate-binding protein
MQAPSPRYGLAFAEICAREGLKRVALMANNNGSSIGIVNSFEKAWAAKGGKVMEKVVYEPNQASYRAELSRVMAAKPDVVVAGSYLPDATVILKDWYQSGATNKWILNSWALNDDLVKAIGSDASEELISVGPVMNVKSPAFNAFDEVYQRAMGTAGTNNVDAAMNWDAVTLLALALEAGAGDGPDLAKRFRAVANGPGKAVSSFAEGRAALRAGNAINYEGASSSVDFNDTNDAATGYLVSKVEKGRFATKYVLDEMKG